MVAWAPHAAHALLVCDAGECLLRSRFGATAWSSRHQLLFRVRLRLFSFLACRSAVWLTAWSLPSSRLRQMAFGYSSRACCAAWPAARCPCVRLRPRGWVCANCVQCRWLLASAWPSAVAWQPSTSLVCALHFFLRAVAACCFACAGLAWQWLLDPCVDGLARCPCMRLRRHGLWLCTPGW